MGREVRSPIMLRNNCRSPSRPSIAAQRVWISWGCRRPAAAFGSGPGPISNSAARESSAALLPRRRAPLPTCLAACPLRVRVLIPSAWTVAPARGGPRVRHGRLPQLAQSHRTCRRGVGSAARAPPRRPSRRKILAPIRRRPRRASSRVKTRSAQTATADLGGSDRSPNGYLAYSGR
jgi:hypothetical protein